jgi:hypothetical protein
MVRVRAEFIGLLVSSSSSKKVGYICWCNKHAYKTFGLKNKFYFEPRYKKSNEDWRVLCLVVSLKEKAELWCYVTYAWW